ncbi:hypothetical protein JD292_08190 [Leucobacter sp. CSA2]|uniref:Bacterial Ig-like domain-containing protein n=1 Tax=Leucobacter edaphi TaxID=2796472 RepID=A0A934QET6_9MICO|nr:Ig-like domain-containing protein [Leucobacter edaphi]MBK0422052.1 hypothetical protein [Leucobacter edaphi]
MAQLPAGPASDAVAVGPAVQSAEPVKQPQVFSILGRNDRMISQVGELRADLVLKVPHGYVNEKTGDLQQVDGSYLRLGYDARGETGSGKPLDLSMNYINTFKAEGAELWARNQAFHYTVHKVITAGVNDYLVISIEGQMNPVLNPENNVLGGRETKGQLYFSYERSNDPNPTSSAWVSSALTRHEVSYHIYENTRGKDYVAGPISQVQQKTRYGLWSGGQANWGQVLDYGLNGQPAGVMPANSVAADIMNFAYQLPTMGPAGSVSTSFWYAWVKEDGSLATTINSAPIHVTGVEPHGSGQEFAGTTAQAVKNAPPVGPKPTMRYTAEAAAQGLTEKVGVEGEIDLRGAGGTGYYRLLVWPEAGNPDRVLDNTRGQVISYEKGDLFADGALTARALDQAFTIGSAFYNYDIPRPGIPVITSPVDGTVTTENQVAKIAGTGTPGHSISLKFTAGGPITDANDPNLETILDGDRSCEERPCEVIVQPDGTWAFTYTPKTPLADGPYSVVATQTEQDTVFNTTSKPSNPNQAENPTAWGVTFTVDHNAPAPPALDCPAAPSAELRPTIGGSGVEEGAKVFVLLDGDRVGEAKVAGANWSYTFAKDLTPGAHDVAVIQVDRAGNESAPSTPACTLSIALDVPIIGTESIVAVAHPAPGLPNAAPTNWEVFVTNGDVEQVISGGAAAKLERDVTYTLGERLAGGTATDPIAALYNRRGDAVCADAAGNVLPASVFDPAKNQLRIAGTDTVDAPVTCTFSKQTSHTSLVTRRIGGQTLPAAAGWSLSGTPVDARQGEARTSRTANAPEAQGGGTAFQLSQESSSAVTRPGKYALDVQAPAGLSLVGIERLDLADQACAAAAPEPGRAEERCWVRADAPSTTVLQGTHEVFRAVAASPGDLPGLPLTGGMGSWIFTLGGLAALALTGAACAQRRFARVIRLRTEI